MFANLAYGVKWQTETDFNEIQKSAEFYRTDSLGGIVAKCKNVCDAWHRVWNMNIHWIDKNKSDPEGLTRVSPLSGYSMHLSHHFWRKTHTKFN